MAMTHTYTLVDFLGPPTIEENISRLGRYTREACHIDQDHAYSSSSSSTSGSSFLTAAPPLPLVLFLDLLLPPLGL